jgi:carbamate kinase
MSGDRVRDRKLEGRVIVVMGGNAFATPREPLTMAGQFRFAQEALSCLRPVLVSERQIVITHGNGPQVGHMLIRVEEALRKAFAIPLEVCVAESEGELGYVLQQSLYNLLAESGCKRPIASLLTQVVVDAADPGFQNPTKPVGPFYDSRRAAGLREKGFAVCEDGGRGFRRVVPSPFPQEIVEVAVIEQLVGAGLLVIAAGGRCDSLGRRQQRPAVRACGIVNRRG